jgi:short-chain fatty acids transporter
MLRRIGELSSRGLERVLPDAFSAALLLTTAAFALAWWLTPAGPWRLVEHWRDGFWSLLAFSMQMALILVTGHALATAPAVRRLLEAVANRAQGTPSAVVLVSLVAMIAALINWGLGLVCGAFLAREVGRSCAVRGIRVHYPLVAAAGYTAMLVWHGGLSGSAPLQIATPGHVFEARIGVVPVDRTIFSPMNGVMTLLLLALVPVVLARMAPIAPKDIVVAPGEADTPPRREPDAAPTPGARVDRSPWLARTIAAVALGGAVALFATRGLAALTLDSVNFLFLFLGLMLHGSARRYGEAVGEGARGAAGILLQFPFYAGIMAMVERSGLIVVVAEAFVQLSESAVAVGVPADRAFPVLSFLSAGVVNLFIPSGGGQWAVQGPIVMEAGARLGVPIEKSVMAVAYGDEWTNLLQPFWALPLLAITRVRVGSLLGYTAVLLVATCPLYAFVLAFW